MRKESFTRTQLVVASLGFLILCSLFIFFFKKKKSRQSSSVPKLSASFQKKHFQPGALLFTAFYDLENSKEKCISAEKSFSGIRSCKLSLSTEYGFSVIKKLKEIPDYKKLKEIQIEFKCWMRSDVSKTQYLVLIDDANGKNIATLSKPITSSKKFEWNTLRYSFSVDEKYLIAENTIRIFPWNKELREFFIDDITISYFGENKNGNQSAINPNYFFDFENPRNEIVQTENIKPGIAHSGKMSVDLSNSQEFGPIVTKQFGEVCLAPPTQIGISVWVYPLTDNPTAEVAVSLFNSKNENYFWKGKSAEKQLLPKETWTKISANIVIPQETITLDDVIQIITRNKGKTKLLFDDLEIVYDNDEQRKGAASEMNSNSNFSPQRNVPPFPVIYFLKDEIGNRNSTFINDQQTDQSNNFSPNDQFIVGNFLADENGLDELINIKSSGSALYSFCHERSAFSQLWEGEKEIDLHSDKMVGDFNNNGTDELLLINKKNKTGQLLSFNSTSACGPNNTQIRSDWKAAGSLLEGWNTTENDVLMSGDFNGDKTDELLVLNSISGDWSIFQFVGMTWKKIATNTSDNKFATTLFNSSNSKYIVGKFDASKKQDVILVSVKTNDNQKYIQLEYNAGKKQFQQKNISDDSSQEIFFKNSNTTFIGNYTATEPEILNLNTDWRFDLKLIKLDEKGLYTESSVDFKGYPEDHNPKYYELVKIIAGNFKTKNSTSILVMMGNCADKNFNGINCTQFENLNTLPGSTQLYSIKH